MGIPYEPQDNSAESRRRLAEVSPSKRVLITYKTSAAASAGRRLALEHPVIRKLREKKPKSLKQLKHVHVDVLEVDSEDGHEAVTVLCSQATHAADVVCEVDQALRFRDEPTPTVNDPYMFELWGHEAMRVPEAWQLTTGSGPVTHRPIIGVVDTGIDYRHPELAPNMWVNEAEANGLPGVDDDDNGYVDDIYGWDFANEDADPMDDEGHGSHCAGIIGAAANNGQGITGVSWAPRLMALKFLRSDGTGYLSNAVRALDYAVANGARVSSNSWGGASYSAALHSAVQVTLENNMLVVTAAGNDGTNHDGVPDYPASFGLANIINVAATDKDHALASFSSFGPSSVHVAAPGVSILSMAINGQYALRSGTSMAAPQVAGLAALLLALVPNLSYSAAIEAMTATSTEVLQRDPANPRGIKFGAVDARAALEHVQDRIWVRWPLDFDGLVAVPAGGSVSIPLSIAPFEHGVLDATIEFRTPEDGTAAAAQTSASVSVRAAGVAQQTATVPSSLSTAATPVGEESAAVAVALSNPGAAPLAVEFASLEGSGADSFVLAPAIGQVFVLPAGESSETGVSVKCAPSETGTRTATVTLRTNEGSADVTQLTTERVVTLSCQATAAVPTTTTTTTTTVATTSGASTPLPPFPEGKIVDGQNPLVQFRRRAAHAIVGHNDLGLVAAAEGNPRSCAAACLAEPACKSFEFHTVRGQCHLSTARAADVAEAAVVTPKHKMVDLYERYYFV